MDTIDRFRLKLLFIGGGVGCIAYGLAEPREALLGCKNKELRKLKKNVAGGVFGLCYVVSRSY